MTTVLGVYVPQFHEDIAILVSDRQSTLQNQDQSPTLKDMGGRKLFTSKDDYAVMGHAGTRAPNFYPFIEGFQGGKYNIEKIISEGSFPELRDMNMERIGDTMIKPDEVSSFLLMTRYGEKPRIHYCHPFGKVEPMGVCSIGSGTERVTAYFDARTVMNDVGKLMDHKERATPTHKQMIQTAIEALAYAQGTDLYSSGFDMAVMLPGETRDHFADLQDNLTKRIRRIQRNYNGVSKKD